MTSLGMPPEADYSLAHAINAVAWLSAKATPGTSGRIRRCIETESSSTR